MTDDRVLEEHGFGTGVTVERLAGGLPVVVRPVKAGLQLPEWAAQRREQVRRCLSQAGAILFRGFSEVSVDGFDATVRALSGDPLQYVERSSPRHPVSGNIYTSTDHPPNQRIFLHNEQSYSRIWPMRLFFCCVVPPRSGGTTPLADCRRVYQRLPKPARERFEASGYCYVRNFGEGLGLNWPDVFQTTDRAVVERYCLDNWIDVEWRPGGELTTRQVRPAVATHPETGDKVWFNHLAFFHVSTLEPSIASALLDVLGPDRLPNNTYYADGTEIESPVLDQIRAAYAAETVEYPWQEGDVLMLDNMLVAHGRSSYRPPRQIVVAMAEPHGGTPIP